MGVLANKLLAIVAIVLMVFRCIPVELVHTLLLGPYKYLLPAKMAKLTQKERAELSARISAFPASGRIKKMFINIAKHYKSFVGRDFKAFAQLALFVLSPCLHQKKKFGWPCLRYVHLHISCLHLLLPYTYSGWRIAGISIQKRWCPRLSVQCGVQRG